MRAHGLSAAFTVNAGYEASAVSGFTLFEAQRLELTGVPLYGASGLSAALGGKDTEL